MPPLNAVLKQALDHRANASLRAPAEKRREHNALAFFYAARNFAPVWSKDGAPVAAVRSLTERLGHAGEDALVLANTPAALKTDGDPAEVADSELAFTEAVVSYAREATGSRVDPQTISTLIGYKPALADPAEILESLADAGQDAGDKLRALNPSEPRYLALRDKLVALRAARAPLSGTAIPAGPTLRVGMHDDRVPLLRARFHLSDTPGSLKDGTRYDAQVAQAVAAFQRANELPLSGALTMATVEALAGTKPSRLEGTLAANMEIWRWMPRDLGENRIEVNIPDYLVTVFKDGQVAAQHRVVVGKTDTPTPLFSNTMKYLIVNPYWNVPQSIVRKEMLPKGGGDLSYLDGRGYSVAWHGGQWVVKQLPGDKNALGRIKFLFPNDYAVYLHDTPSKALFSASKRAFSHGCVRVDQPFAFAETVLATAALPDGKGRHWSAERLEDMIGDKEHYLNLPAPLPIAIEYFTASVDPVSGTVKLRDDVYGYVRAVAAQLGQPVEPVAVAQTSPRLVGEHVRRKTAVDDFDPR